MTTIQHYTPAGFAKIWKDSKRWRLRVGMCCPCNFCCFIFPRCFRNSHRECSKLSHTFTFELLMSRILESHSASWLFALEWTFKEGLHGVQVFQVKFAACAQASWFDLRPCERLNTSVWPFFDGSEPYMFLVPMLLGTAAISYATQNARWPNSKQRLTTNSLSPWRL